MSSSKNWPVNGICDRRLFVWGPEPHTLPPLHVTQYSVYVFTVYVLIHKGKGEELNQRKVGVAIVRKAGSKLPTWLTASPVYKLW